jgi:hypothetical protein
MIFVKFNMPSENSSCRCFVCKFVQFEIQVFSFLFNYFLANLIIFCLLELIYVISAKIIQREREKRRTVVNSWYDFYVKLLYVL